VGRVSLPPRRLMPTGAELLRQLQQRRAPAAAAVPRMSQVEDEWTTDENGRRHRVRAAVSSAAVGSCAESRMAASASTIAGGPATTTEAAGWEIVRQHSSEFACWIVVGGRVLDVTAYLGHHPGGGTIIRKLGGKDATRAYEKARHSRAADLKLHDFDIGALSDVARLSRAAGGARERRERLEAAAAYLD
jgi:cytochrome b involved in lipid metabolism